MPTATCSPAPGRLGHRRGRPRQRAAHPDPGRSTRTPSSTNTATTRCSTRFPPTAGRAPKTTSASGSSTRPSNILSGGASKQELVCHFATTATPTRSSSNYWRGTHYGGGATCNIAAGEEWSKVIGPMFIYCNSLDEFETPHAGRPRHAGRHRRQSRPFRRPGRTTPPRCGRTRLRRQKRKSALALRLGQRRGLSAQEERGSVTGQLVLNDPQAATTKLPNLTVGLAHPDYRAIRWRWRRQGFADGGTGDTSDALQAARRRPSDCSRHRTIRKRRHGRCRTARAAAGGNGFAGQPNVDWAHDAKFYQFWNDGTRRRQVHDHQRPSRHLHAARLRRRRAGRIRASRHHRRGRAKRWISASWNGSRSATASKSGRSAIPTAPATNSSKATAKTTGSGAGACAIRCSSRTTSPTPSARAITARIGSSSRRRTRIDGLDESGGERSRPTSASAG